MGQYFKAVDIETEQVIELSYPGNFGLTHECKCDQMDSDELLNIFSLVESASGITFDNILLLGDYGYVIYYHQHEHQFQTTEATEGSALEVLMVKVWG